MKESLVLVSYVGVQFPTLKFLHMEQLIHIFKMSLVHKDKSGRKKNILHNFFSYCLFYIDTKLLFRSKYNIIDL